MTISYAAGVFEVTNAEHDKADLEAEKGSPIATTDTIKIFTGTSEGSVIINSSDDIGCSIEAGKNASAVDSRGTLRIMGGGRLSTPAAGYLGIYKDYGTLETGSATRSTPAVIDAQQCTSDINLQGILDCRHLQIQDIKSGGVVSLQDVQGKLYFPDFYGYGGAQYTIQGTPQAGFYCRGPHLGRAKSGFYTYGANNANLDFITSLGVGDVAPVRAASHPVIPTPGRPASRALPGTVGVGKIRLKLHAQTDAAIENLLQDLDVLQADEVAGLLVLTAHSTDKSLPMDYLMRARPIQPLQRYEPGIHFRTATVDFMGDE